MIAFNAHFDGKVIVPDEPVDLPINQKVRIRLEQLDADAPSKVHDPGAGEDVLWQKGMLPKNSSRKKIT